MKRMKNRVESDEETVVKHQHSYASPMVPPVAAVLTADTCSNNGVRPVDHNRQDPNNPSGQVCLKCKYGLHCNRSLCFSCFTKCYTHALHFITVKL